MSQGVFWTSIHQHRQSLSQHCIKDNGTLIFAIHVALRLWDVGCSSLPECARSRRWERPSAMRPRPREKPTPRDANERESA
eukprot:307494-Rhodomonas_salina.2